MRSSLRVSLVFLLGLTLARAGAEGDPAHETPASSRVIKLGTGSVDAITGDLNLRVPLGPRLPGRIPLGFTWSYDNQDTLQSKTAQGGGGVFRPVVWNSNDSPLQVTVMVDGRPIVFYRHFSTTKMPSSADLLQAMAQRHVQPVQPASADSSSFYVGAIPSSDGTKFLLNFGWTATIEHYNSKTDTTTTTTVPVGVGYAILDGPNAIWTQISPQPGHAVTHFTNLWGDHVTVDEATATASTDYIVVSQIVIQDQVVPANTLTMAVSLSGTPTTTRKSGTDLQTGLAYNYPWTIHSSGSINITNTLGMPTVSLSGSFGATQRFYAQAPQWCPGYSATAPPVPEGTWDDGFTPTQITQATANGAESQALGIVWGAYGYGPSEIDYPSGLKESFTYGGVVRLSRFSFSRCDGTWNGFMWWQGTSTNMDVISDTGDTGVTLVTRQDTKNPGVADESYQILRAQPTWTGTPSGQNKTTWTCTQTENRTAILHYGTANPANGGPYRAVRLTSPTYNPNVDPTGVQGYLFASSAILYEEAFAGSGTVATPDALGTSPYQITVYDGFDIRSWANPSGALGSGLPVNAVAYKTTTYTQGLPTRTTIAGDPNVAGSWDDYGPVVTDEYADPPQSMPTADGTKLPTWRTALSATGSHAIHRQGKITREADFNVASRFSTLMRLVNLTDNKSLQADSTSLGSLRFSAPGTGGQAPTSGVSSVDFGTTTYTYDSLGRIIEQVGDRASYTAVEARNYLSGLPLLSDTTKSLTGPSGAIHPNPAQPSVMEGKTYTWTDTHLQGGPSSITDKADGRAETFLYNNALGKETSHTDVLGVTTTTSYDGWGRVQTVTRQAKGSVGSVSTTTTYDPNGRWKKVQVTADGQTLTSETDFDAFGRTVAVTTYDANGAQATRQTFTYDGFGQKIGQSPVLVRNQASWGYETWTYDSEGRVVDHYDRCSAPGSTTGGRWLSTVSTQPTWSSVGGVTGVVTTTTSPDPNVQSPVRGQTASVTRSEVRDLLGQKAAVVDQLGQVSRYFYDQDGHLLQTLQGSQQRSYTYNAMGWMISRTEPEEGTTSYSNFTLSGTPLTSVQSGRSGSRSNTFTTSLNSWLLPATLTASGPEGTVTRTLTYDPTTHLLSKVQETQPNGTFTESYGYDTIGRLTSKSMTDGSQTFGVSQALDASGRVVSLSYPAGGGRADVVTYAYNDPLGRMVSVKLNGETQVSGSMLYDQVSGTAVSQTLTLGNNAWTTSKVDKGDMTEVTHVAPSGVLEDDAMAWAPGGLLLSRGTDAWTYDVLQRLKTAHTRNPADGSFVDQSFGYDLYGNRISSSAAYGGAVPANKEALSWTASYGDGRNSLPATLTAASGSLSTGVAYDDLGRMTQVWTTPGQVSTQTTWTYDPSGRVVKENGTRYLLEGSGLRFKRLKSDGTVDYMVYGFHREPLFMATVGTTGTFQWRKTLVYGFGQLIREVDSVQGTTYNQCDQVGSPNYLTNAAGTKVGQAKTLSYGEQLFQWGDTSIRRFTNHEQDADSSAIYMQAREYLAAYGKFAQVDPAYDQTKDDPESWNLYNYVTNNPVTHTDPDGRMIQNADYDAAVGHTAYINALAHDSYGAWFLSTAEDNLQSYMEFNAQVPDPGESVGFSSVFMPDGDTTFQQAVQTAEQLWPSPKTNTAQTTTIDPHNPGSPQESSDPLYDATKVSPDQPNGLRSTSSNLDKLAIGLANWEIDHNPADGLIKNEHGAYIVGSPTGSAVPGKVMEGDQDGVAIRKSAILGLIPRGFTLLADWHHHWDGKPGAALGNRDADLMGTAWMRGYGMGGSRFHGYAVSPNYLSYVLTNAPKGRYELYRTQAMPSGRTWTYRVDLIWSR